MERAMAGMSFGYHLVNVWEERWDLEVHVIIQAHWGTTLCH